MASSARCSLRRRLLLSSCLRASSRSRVGLTYPRLHVSYSVWGVGALVWYPYNCRLFLWEMKLLLSLPFPSSLPVAVVRLSGHFLCYLCHSFFWVTSLLVSQPCLLKDLHNTLSLMICKVSMPFRVSPAAIPFWPAWFLLH